LPHRQRDSTFEAISIYSPIEINKCENRIVTILLGYLPQLITNQITAEKSKNSTTLFFWNETRRYHHILFVKSPNDTTKTEKKRLEMEKNDENTKAAFIECLMSYISPPKLSVLFCCFLE
jgi:hypothetical protein